MKLATACLSVTAFSVFVTGFNAVRYWNAGPLTTLTAYALTDQRAELGGDKEQEEGMQAVLQVLGDIHQIIDGTMRTSRLLLLEKLRVEVQLADATSGVQAEGAKAGRLRGLGVTAKALSDMDRCEYDLRTVASLVSQLIIDTEDTSGARVSKRTYEEFLNTMRLVNEQLQSLARTAKVRDEEWLRWAEKLEEGRRAIETKWGEQQDRRSDLPQLRDIPREELENAELEAIGQRELELWRNSTNEPAQGGGGTK